MQGRILYSHTRTAWPSTNLYGIEMDQSAGIIRLRRIGRAKELPELVEVKGRMVKCDEVLIVREEQDRHRSWILRLLLE